VITQLSEKSIVNLKKSISREEREAILGTMPEG
jgi:hypothetical protein